MGCINSTEGVIHSQADGAFQPSPNNQMSIISVPVIPGWDGVAISTIPTHVEFTIQTNWNGTESSMQTLNNTIMAQNTAGAGYKLAAVFLPINTHDQKKKGQPLDGKPIGFRTILGRAMCIFQKDLHDPKVPLETLFLQAPLTVSQSATWSSEQVQVSGYQGLYGQLGQAGQLSMMTRSEYSRA